MKSSLMTDFSPSLPHIRVSVPAGRDVLVYSLTEWEREGLVGFQSPCSTSVQDRVPKSTHSAIYEVLQVFPVDQEWRSDPAYQSWRHTERRPCPRGEHLSCLFCIEASTTRVLVLTQNDTRSADQSDAQGFPGRCAFHWPTLLSSRLSHT